MWLAKSSDDVVQWQARKVFMWYVKAWKYKLDIQQDRVVGPSYRHGALHTSCITKHASTMHTPLSSMQRNILKSKTDGKQTGSHLRSFVSDSRHEREWVWVSEWVRSHLRSFVSDSRHVRRHKLCEAPQCIGFFQLRKLRPCSAIWAFMYVWEEHGCSKTRKKNEEWILRKTEFWGRQVGVRCLSNGVCCLSNTLCSAQACSFEQRINWTKNKLNKE